MFIFNESPLGHKFWKNLSKQRDIALKPTDINRINLNLPANINQRLTKDTN